MICFHEGVGHGDEAGVVFHGKGKGICRVATRKIGISGKKIWEEQDDQEG